MLLSILVTTIGHVFVARYICNTPGNDTSFGFNHDSLNSLKFIWEKSLFAL